MEQVRQDYVNSSYGRTDMNVTVTAVAYMMPHPSSYYLTQDAADGLLDGAGAGRAARRGCRSRGVSITLGKRPARPGAPPCCCCPLNGGPISRPEGFSEGPPDDDKFHECPWKAGNLARRATAHPDRRGRCGRGVRTGSRKSSSCRAERALEALAGVVARRFPAGTWRPASCGRRWVVGQLGPGEERFPKDETYSVNDYPSVGLVIREGESSLAVVDDPNRDSAQRELLVATRQGVEPVGPDGLSTASPGASWGDERSRPAAADGRTTRPSCAPSRTSWSARSTGRSCSPRSRRSHTPTRSPGSLAGARSRPRSRRRARRPPAPARRRSCSATSTTSSR